MATGGTPCASVGGACVLRVDVLRLRHSTVWMGIALSLTLPLASCASGSLTSPLERSLAADPQLQTGAGGFGSPSTAPDLRATASLPPDFPSEIPIYPGAALQAVTAAAASAGSDVSSVSGGAGGAGTASGVGLPAQSADRPAVLTRWLTPDSATQVQQFYQQAFQSNGWQLAANGTSPLDSLRATKSGLQVTLNLAAASAASPAAPTPAPASPTDFSLTYRQLETGEVAATPAPFDQLASPTASVPGSGFTALPQAGDRNFIGPLLPTSTAPAGSPSPVATGAIATPQQFGDLTQAPAELQPYLADLAQLGVLNVSSGQEFKPNQVITRREFARWLVAANNRLYATRPGNQIRLAVATDQPAFQDVPRSDADFAAIQGLATAGIIPSPLSGNSTTVTFRPDAPLTREDLILWKTPLDTRQALPNATLDAVQQTWGFQDTPRIDPKALRAVLADYQNSDLANIRRAFGYTTLFQPKKPVTRAEAAAVLWYFGTQGDGMSAKDAG